MRPAALVLAVLSISGCGDRRNDVFKDGLGPATGAESKLGTILINQQIWCSNLQAAGDGNYFVETAEFRQNSIYIMGVQTLNKNNVLEPSAKSEGRWALIGSTITIKDKNGIVPYTLTVHAGDDATCIDLASNGETNSYCECLLPIRKD